VCDGARLAGATSEYLWSAFAACLFLPTSSFADHERNSLIEGSKLRAAMPHMHPDLLDACLYTYASRSGHNAPLNPYYCLAEAERVDEKLRAFEAAGDRAGLTTYVEARLLIAASSVDDGEEISEWVADVAAEKATTREEVADQREREYVGSGAVPRQGPLLSLLYTGLRNAWWTSAMTRTTASSREWTMWSGKVDL
jgi:hypothetical protein